MSACQLPAGALDDAELSHILAHSPAQTMTWTGPVHLTTSRENPLHLVTTELTVNGVRSPWLLDTGANQSVISSTLARQLHLTLLPGVAHTAGGVTGAENLLRVALLPNLPLGGATAHDVVLLVLDDANLTIAVGQEHPYRIQGIIGLPVLRALGRITFHNSGTFDATAEGGTADDGSPIELRLLNPVLEPAVYGEQIPFTLDTGATSTTLSARFYGRFQFRKNTWETAETQNVGAGGATRTETSLVPALPFRIAGRAVTLHNLPVLQTLQHADIDTLFGNIGQDLLQSAPGFTLDFPHMRFSWESSAQRAAPTSSR